MLTKGALSLFAYWLWLCLAEQQPVVHQPVYLQQLKDPVVKERVKPDASCFWKISASSGVEGDGQGPRKR